MDQKTVALQLRKLAADPDNQTYIVKEKGCMKVWRRARTRVARDGC
jgi:hypothetical protein